MGWFSSLFGREKAAVEKNDEPVEVRAENDFRDVPVDNPMDVREDGSIRPGDPTYDYMMSLMQSGKASIANQRPDGTWETKEL